MMIYCYLGDLRVATELDTLTRTGETGFSNDEPGFVRVGAIKFYPSAVPSLIERRVGLESFSFVEDKNCHDR